MCRINIIRRRMHASLQIFAIIMFISACSPPGEKDVDNGIVFNIDLTDPVLKTAKGNNFYDRVEKAHFIPLETKKECLIGRVLQIRIVNDQIVILNQANSYVYVLFFDMQGRFLHKVSRRGRGPEEYSDASDMDIDPITKDLYILAHNQKKLMHYSNDGIFKKSIALNVDSLSMLHLRFALSDDQQIFTTSMGREPNLAVFDNEGNFQNHFFPTQPGFMSNTFSFSKFKDRILYNNCQNDTVFQIQSGTPKPYIYTDFGTDAYSSGMKHGEYSSLVVVLEGKDHIFMTFSGTKGGYSTLIEKDTGQYELFEWMKTGLFGYSYPRITGVSSSGEFVSLQFATYIFEEYNELMKSPPPGFTFETAISSKLGVEDNPVIMLMSLR